MTQFLLRLIPLEGAGEIRVNPAMALRRHFVLVFAEMKDEKPKDLPLRKMAESTERCEGAPWYMAGPLESGALPSLVVLRGARCLPAASYYQTQKLVLRRKFIMQRR